MIKKSSYDFVSKFLREFEIIELILSNYLQIENWIFDVESPILIL